MDLQGWVISRRAHVEALTPRGVPDSELENEIVDARQAAGENRHLGSEVAAEEALEHATGRSRVALQPTQDSRDPRHPDPPPIDDSDVLRLRHRRQHPAQGAFLDNLGPAEQFLDQLLRTPRASPPGFLSFGSGRGTQGDY